jgi:hypothetical protein
VDGLERIVPIRNVDRFAVVLALGPDLARGTEAVDPELAAKNARSRSADRRSALLRLLQITAL